MLLGVAYGVCLIFMLFLFVPRWRCVRLVWGPSCRVLCMCGLCVFQISGRCLHFVDAYIISAVVSGVFLVASLGCFSDLFQG